MNCANCNAGLNGAPKFCPKCGEKIEARTVEPPATKKCPQCGSENALAAKFCKVDGYRFDSGVPTSGVPATAPRQEPSPAAVAATTSEPPATKKCPQCGSENALAAKFVGTADAWLWDLGDGSPTSTEVTLAHLYDEPGTYTITLIGTAVGLCVAVDTATVDITVVPPAELQPLFEAEPSGDCDAVAVELFNFSTGSSLYVWSFGDGTGSTQTNPVHDYGAPGQYTITLGLIDAICSDTAFTSQTIDVGIPGLTLDLPSSIGLCDGGSEQLDAGAGYDTFSWDGVSEFRRAGDRSIGIIGWP